ncbi:hypothetical protein [Micromonospora sp. CV4]|uniref:hypothetical protein n=1 Tax=Micromonospora sp. CV4 TaxID=2478711 RepID=UPI000EF52E2C|nr:hypothetical protein [Micromonospora sp. CV4]RLP91291.1 hypothetical protein EAD98_24000 [Micromonospora sp. CV4]
MLMVPPSNARLTQEAVAGTQRGAAYTDNDLNPALLTGEAQTTGIFNGGVVAGNGSGRPTA